MMFAGDTRLSSAEAEDLLVAVGNFECTDAQAGALLAALRMRKRLGLGIHEALERALRVRCGDI